MNKQTVWRIVAACVLVLIACVAVTYKLGQLTIWYERFVE